ncbi:MAG: nickel-responsive transcriptional regulator NikR [Deltaproteobacteria bacterium]|nr:nickel-responsive transcriptional regulator NikR [Deltaproteobacteria bacterium]
MSELVRFSVSVEQTLLDRFDGLNRAKQYTNRSEALRDLIRKELVQQEWKSGRDVVGTITLIYDHHKRDVLIRVMDMQHDFQEAIISTQHIHLDHHNCLEIVAARGKAEEVQRLADALRSIKGVRYATLSMSSTGREIE